MFTFKNNTVVFSSLEIVNGSLVRLYIFKRIYESVNRFNIRANEIMKLILRRKTSVVIN